MSNIRQLTSFKEIEDRIESSIANQTYIYIILITDEKAPKLNITSILSKYEISEADKIFKIDKTANESDLSVHLEDQSIHDLDALSFIFIKFFDLLVDIVEYTQKDLEFQPNTGILIKNGKIAGKINNIEDETEITSLIDANI